MAFVNFERIGKQQEDRLQPVRVTFANPRHVEDIFSRRKNLKGTTLFVARDLSREELRERDRERQTAKISKRLKPEPHRQHPWVRTLPAYLPSNRAPLPRTRSAVTSSSASFDQRPHSTPFPNHTLPIRPTSNSSSSSATRPNHTRLTASSSSSSSNSSPIPITSVSRQPQSQHPRPSPILTSNPFQPLTHS